MANYQDQTAQAGVRPSLWEATSKVGALNPLRETQLQMCALSARESQDYRLLTSWCANGKKVVVIDDGAIGRGMTARTTAHIVNALDDRYYEIEKLHGQEGARYAAESHTAAIRFH